MTPPFDNAAMDGYALDSTALEGGGPWRLSVVERIAAGEVAAGQVSRRTAARILTGAPVPPGADTVVKQESVIRDGATVILDRRPLPGNNIRRAGDDMRLGEIVLRDGVRLGAREIAACAAAGAARVHIRRALRVGLLVTGSEIRHTGSSRQAAQIWDVNTPMLCSELSRPDVDLVKVTQGVDDRTELRRRIEAALNWMRDFLCFPRSECVSAFRDSIHGYRDTPQQHPHPSAAPPASCWRAPRHWSSCYESTQDT